MHLEGLIGNAFETAQGKVLRRVLLCHRSLLLTTMVTTCHDGGESGRAERAIGYRWAGEYANR